MEGFPLRRRDYEILSRALKAVRPLRGSYRGNDWYIGWLDAVESIADHMQQEIPVFDRQLFLHNCGVEHPRPCSE